MIPSNNYVRKLFHEHAVANSMLSYIGNDLEGESKSTFQFHTLNASGRINTYMSATVEDNECYCIELISHNFTRKDYQDFRKFIKMLTSCVIMIDIELDKNSPAVHIAKKMFTEYGGMYKPNKDKINFVWVKEGAICF